MAVSKASSNTANRAQQVQRAQESQKAQEAKSQADPANVQAKNTDALQNPDVDVQRAAVDPAIQADARTVAAHDVAALNRQHVVQSQEVRAARPPAENDPAARQSAVEIYAGVQSAMGDQNIAQNMPDIANLQPGQELEASGKLTLPNGSQARVKVEASVSSSLRPGLEESERVNLKVTGSLSGGLSTGDIGVGDHASVGAAFNTGLGASFKASMSPEQYAAVRAGTAPFPNPMDPNSIPEGGSVTLNAGAFSQSQFEATFRGLNIDTRHTEAAGFSVGIARLDDDKVRIHAGPGEMVRNELSLSAGLGPVSAGIGVEKTLTNGQSRTADIDISTPEGRATYDRFLQTGEFPASGMPGVSNSGTVSHLNYSHQAQAGVELDLGNFKVGANVEINSAEAQRRIVNYDDGRSIDTIRQRINDTTLVTRQVTGADGQMDPEKTGTSVLFNNMNPHLATYLNMAFTGENTSFQKPQDVELQLNQNQLEALQGRIGDGIEGNPIMQRDGLYQDILAAQNPHEFGATLVRRLDANRLPERLLSIYGQDRSQGPFAGDISLRSND